MKTITGSTVARVNTELLEEVRIVARLTGRPLQTCLNHALEIWLQEYGSSDLKHELSRIHDWLQNNPHERLTKPEEELIQRFDATTGELRGLRHAASQ
jgi:hypothetical protein